LQWAHDSMRSRDAGDGGELTIRTAEPSRNLEHLCRLLAEHLAKVELKAPVGELRLAVTEVVSLEERSGSLLPDETQAKESLQLVLERIAARLGPERVLRAVLTDDHRLEWMQMWQPVPKPIPRKGIDPDTMPQPTWVLPQPLKLATRGHRPLYQGALHLLTGPHRVEGGWWHRLGAHSSEGSQAEAAAQRTGHVQRDYWVALSEHAGVLWVYQHGIFA
jgi:protein ImuB